MNILREWKLYNIGIVNTNKNTLYNDLVILDKIIKITNQNKLIIKYLYDNFLNIIIDMSQYSKTYIVDGKISFWYNEFFLEFRITHFENLYSIDNSYTRKNTLELLTAILKQKHKIDMDNKSIKFFGS